MKIWVKESDPFFIKFICRIEQIVFKLSGNYLQRILF